jgi:multidrug efflux pump subunit AcrB
VNFVDFAVKRWQFTIVVFAMLAALGVVTLLRVPKTEDPNFPIPVFPVIAVYPGANPLDLEKLVVIPIEEKLTALDDVKSLKTEIDDGLAVVVVEFNAGVDAAAKYDDVLREVNGLRPDLPAEIVRLEVKKTNSNNVAVSQAALVGPGVPYRELERWSERLERRLEALPGVRDAEQWAYPKQQVEVALDLERISALGLSPRDVIGAIQGTNSNIPAGAIDSGARRFNVRTTGDYASVKQIEDTVVTAVGDERVLLRDLAKVSLDASDETHVGRFNGERASFVTAKMKEGENVLAVRGGIQAELGRFAQELPPGIRLERGFDQAKNVEHRLAGFTRDFAIAIALVLLTLLPLGVRASAIVMVSIPLSLAMGVTLLDLFGFGINQLSIVGFVIALGLLVDDSVVVVENITRFLRQGHTPREAAIRGTKQILVSVLGCTATLVFAFLPLLMLPGAPGQFIRSLPMAVVVTVVASLFVSLTIVPFLASLLLKSEGEHGNRALQLLERVIEGSYRRVLGRAIGWPKLTVLAAIALFAGSLALVPKVGFSVFPKAGVPQFLVKVETPEGSALSETDRAVRFVEGVLEESGAVTYAFANVGRGNPQIYYNIASRNERPNIGEVYAELRHFDPKHSPALFDQLRERFRQYAGARIQLLEFENGPPVDAPIAVRVVGDDLNELSRLSAEVAKILQATSGTRDVIDPGRDRKADLRLVVDRERAGLLGVPLADVDALVRLGVTGLSAGKYRDTAESDDARDILVRLPRSGRPTPETLDRISLPSPAGAVPLSQIAHFELEASPATIRHYARQRSVTVTSAVGTGFTTDAVSAAAYRELSKLDLPQGYRLLAAGEAESKKDSFGGLGSAIIIAAFAVIAILVLEFGTFRSTLIVASVIPLGIVGGIAALYVTGNTLSFTAAIGFIALIGIEVKNSILLVDFTNQLRREGMALDLAIQRAGEIRFVPILLTTLTALGGLIPLALENSSLYSPLAFVIMGGLISSTILTRVVTPVMYKLLPPTIESDEHEERATSAMEGAPVAAE